MKRLLLVMVLFSLFVITPDSVAAQVDDDSQGGGYFLWPLCLPGMQGDGSCLLYGPAQTVAAMEESGFPYPLRDLPAVEPPEEMGVMPVLIAKINLPDHQPAPIYGTFDDAVAGTNPVSQIDAGSLRYISYVNRLDYNGNAYVQLSTGGWMRASPVAYTDFQGLNFFDNPRNDFGWMIDQVQSYTEPSFNAPFTDQSYNRGDVIQVYNTIEAEGYTWYQIAMDEWAYSPKARVVSVNTTPPEGVDTGRWVEINLFQQTMSVYEGGQLLFATLIASGLEPFYTQPGLFKIDEKKPLETMQGSFEADRSDFYYLQDVPWTMYYDQNRALHATYWPFGYGTTQSHGCINLSPGDARWLFEWADEGDYVWVHDPSGLTPTDPDFYGAGAP